MSEPYILVSAINISRSPTAICVPLFARYLENQVYLSVTDVNLRISHFQEVYDFEDRRFHLPGDLGVDYEYNVGDVAPLVLRHEGVIVAISSNDLSDLIDRLRSLIEFPNDIFEELLRDVDRPELSRARIYERDAAFVSGHDRSDDIDPKGATLWLDEVITELKLRPNSEEAISLVRLKLLSWAKEIAENATSPIFAHFLKSLSVAEEAGVYVEDLLAAALLKRISEGVPRRDSIPNLVVRYRTKYQRSPLSSVLDLSKTGDGVFSKRADEVLESFFSFALSSIVADNLKATMVLALVAEAGHLWPPEIETAISARTKEVLSKLMADVEAHNLERERLTQSLRDMASAEAFYRTADDPFLRAAQESRRNIAKYAAGVRSHLTLLDSMAKVRRGTQIDDANMAMSSVDYSNLGLNEDFFSNLLSHEHISEEEADALKSGNRSKINKLLEPEQFGSSNLGTPS